MLMSLVDRGSPSLTSRGVGDGDNEHAACPHPLFINNDTSESARRLSEDDLEISARDTVDVKAGVQHVNGPEARRHDIPLRG